MICHVFGKISKKYAASNPQEIIYVKKFVVEKIFGSKNFYPKNVMLSKSRYVKNIFDQKISEKKYYKHFDICL